jgi:CHAD domain-containing protein
VATDRFSVPGVDAGTPIATAAPAILIAKGEPFFQLEDAARSGADVDAVHDMRVASRRLREATRLFVPLYPPKASAQWSARVRRVTRALGPVRDADVFVETFGKFAPGLDEGGRRAVAFMVGQRLGQREQQLTLLNHELSRLDLHRARKEFTRLATSLEDDEQGRRPLADFAHAAVAERAAAVFRLQPDALDEANVANQHALRILYKQLRYAVEVFATCYGEGFDPVHDVLTDVQDALGDLHDHHLFLDLVNDPVLVAAARRGGVSRSDLDQVCVVLDARAREAYGRFIALEAAHPAESMLPDLLLPLTRRIALAEVSPAGTIGASGGADGSASGVGSMGDADAGLGVRVVEESDTSLPYLTDTGELVLPQDDIEFEPSGDFPTAGGVGGAGERGAAS